MKTIVWTIVICTPLGLIWNYFHYYSGIVPAWIFPLNQVIGLEILGIPIEDYFFYPITGGFFTTMYMLDPLKKIFNPRSNPLWLKYVLYILLIYLVYFGVYIFGKSGSATAVFFGVPAIILFLPIFRDFNVWRFVRIAVIVVTTNVIWDIWATPEQWFYPTNTGVFSPHFWYLGIPAEMTPYLGIMSSYFVFSVASNIKNIVSSQNKF